MNKPVQEKFRTQIRNCLCIICGQRVRFVPTYCVNKGKGCECILCETDLPANVPVCPHHPQDRIQEALYGGGEG